MTVFAKIKEVNCGYSPRDDLSECYGGYVSLGIRDIELITLTERRLK